MPRIRLTEKTQAPPESFAEDRFLSAGSNLVNHVKGLFEAFKTSRLPWEALWEECWHNYMGQYIAANNWKPKTEGAPGKSRAFVKLTTLKCNTAHSKIIDVLFCGKSEVPFDMVADLSHNAGMNPDQLEDIIEAKKKELKEHFRSIEFEELLDTAILEKAILGTGVLKGPIVEMRKKTRAVPRTVAGLPISEFDSSVKQYDLESYMEPVAVIDHVPLWEYYTDINAKSPKDAIGEIHFQRLLPANFRKLAHQGGYNKEAVYEAARRATENDENDKRYIQLGDNWTGEQGDKDKRVSTLEYWGLVPVIYLKETGCEIPADVDDEDSIEALVVIAADGILIKACVNPLGYRPFYVSPFKKRPHVIYGMGIAEMMRDSQKIINSAVRLIIDNKALSGNLMTAINLDRLSKKNKNNDVYPGKTWYLKGNIAPKEAVDSINFPDVTAGLRELVEMFERFSDEETGLPKYTNGQQDSFLNKTAAGMSMLMTQANINLKTVLKNIDNYWIEPIVEAFFSWNEEFSETPAPIPLKVKATGSDSLIAKELKMEQYMRFMEVTRNPQDAIFMDRVKLMTNIARILETDDVMRPKEEIESIIAEMSKQGSAPKDMRELIDWDRLYPLLERSEQIQFLKIAGIEPDTGKTTTQADDQLELEAVSKAAALKNKQAQKPQAAGVNA